MTADDIVPAGSCAVLIGVSAYEYAGFPPIRAARNSLQAMRCLLADPALCAWPPESIAVIANPISADGLAAQIADLARATTGVLLLYYVGHAVVPARGPLCLTVTSTDPGQPDSSGLPGAALADVLHGSPAQARLSILDCCIDGQAIRTPAGDGPPAGDGHQGLAGITQVDGGYTLAAMTRAGAAPVPGPEQRATACTPFTGELRDMIAGGIPGGPPLLTFTDIYPVLRERLLARGLPAPGQSGTGTAREFAFTANAAAPGRPRPHRVRTGNPGARMAPPLDRAGALPPLDGADAVLLNGAGGPSPRNREPVPSRRSRHEHLVTEALRAAQSIPEGNPKTRALVAVARAVAPADPDRAARLVADAHRVAQSIGDAGQKASALAAVAGPLASSDADAAETVAQSIPEMRLKASALAAAAQALAVTDPGRAGRLIADAERSAQSVPDAGAKASALVAVIKALAIIDPDHGEQVVQLIPGADRKVPALAALAEAVAAADPDRAGRLIADAERAARPIPGASSRVPALAAVARALAVTDADRAGRLIADAERSAQSIPGADRKASALAAVASAMAAVDPGHAERIAQSISAAGWRASALAAVVQALVAGDPGRAAQPIAGSRCLPRRPGPAGDGTHPG